MKYHMNFGGLQTRYVYVKMWDRNERQYEEVGGGARLFKSLKKRSPINFYEVAKIGVIVR